MPAMPKPNHMILYEKCEPPFQSGDNHRLRISQRLYEDDGNVLTNIDTADNQLPRNQDQFFKVVGPRFRIMPSAIHGAFPPANSQVPYDDRLPQIVLRRRTLPWERPITVNQTQVPWMALLLIRQDEIDDGFVEFHDSMRVSTIASHINNNGGSLSISSDEGAVNAMAMDIRRTFFRAICPTFSEINLLTHVRQVNTADKELMGMDEDGWFSVVVGNRLPTINFNHTAVLVSMEGNDSHVPFIGEARSAAEDDEEGTNHNNSNMLRFIVLAKWEFRCQGAGSFERIMKGIPTRGGVAMLGQSKAAATGQTSTSDQLALDTGHVPLQHQTRIGERTMAWYRGALTPFAIDRDLDVGPFHSADQARRVDPYTGLENLGYATAFEVGRMMALADKRFAAELMHWRRTVHLKKQKRIEFNRFDTLRFHDRIPPIEDLLGKMELIMFGEMFEDLLGIRDLDQFGATILPVVDPTGIMNLGGNTLPGLDFSSGSFNNEIYGLTPDLVSTPGIAVMPGYGSMIDSFVNGAITADIITSFEDILNNPDVLAGELNFQRDNLLGNE